MYEIECVPLDEEVQSELFSALFLAKKNNNETDVKNIVEKLFLANIKLVGLVIKNNFHNMVGTMYFDDIYQNGCAGLEKAIRSYEIGKARKSTYFTVCIRNQIGMYLRKANKHISKEIAFSKIYTEDDEGNILEFEDMVEIPDRALIKGIIIAKNHLLD
jgi:RNA polymerase sigma factor (sigma-70 family)